MAIKIGASTISAAPSKIPTLTRPPTSVPAVSLSNATSKMKPKYVPTITAVSSAPIRARLLTNRLSSSSMRTSVSRADRDDVAVAAAGTRFGADAMRNETVFVVLIGAEDLRAVTHQLFDHFRVR